MIYLVVDTKNMTDSSLYQFELFKRNDGYEIYDEFKPLANELISIKL